MDKPFDTRSWQPTHSDGMGVMASSTRQLELLGTTLTQQTMDLIKHPYDPRSWLARADSLRRLRYPELAVGDAVKAALLCEVHLRLLRGHGGNGEGACKAKTWRLGYGMGFWMSPAEEEAEQEAEEVGVGDVDEEWALLGRLLVGLAEIARRTEERSLWVGRAGGERKGKFRPRPYPWLSRERAERSDELVARLQREVSEASLEAVERGSGVRPSCEVRRHAFGDAYGSDPDSNKNVLGVFATRDIPAKALILVDRSRIWGCNGPGRNGNRENLFGGSGCNDPVHPNLPEETAGEDLRWVRDELGRDAATILLKIRLLLAAAKEDVHPLDHPLIARLTPTYDYDGDKKPQSFYPHDDVQIPLRALQQVGVDVFADHRFDTWVMFTVWARAENNSCGDVLSEALMPLFSLFNHSCEPNCDWNRTKEGRGLERTLHCVDEEYEGGAGEHAEEGADHGTVVVTASRDIRKGEQLFVEYDSFVHDDPVEERRRRLKKWLAGDCMCERCVREAKAEEKQCEVKTQPQWCGAESARKVKEGAIASWDDSGAVVLPEEIPQPDKLWGLTWK